MTVLPDMLNSCLIAFSLVLGFPNAFPSTSATWSDAIIRPSLIFSATAFAFSMDNLREISAGFSLGRGVSSMLGLMHWCSSCNLFNSSLLKGEDEAKIIGVVGILSLISLAAYGRSYFKGKLSVFH